MQLDLPRLFAIHGSDGECRDRSDNDSEQGKPVGCIHKGNGGILTQIMEGSRIQARFAILFLFAYPLARKEKSMEDDLTRKELQELNTIVAQFCMLLASSGCAGTRFYELTITWKEAKGSSTRYQRR